MVTEVVHKPQSGSIPVFYCHTHLEDRPAAESSPDPRYCQSCYNYLVEQATNAPPAFQNRKYNGWVPISYPDTATVVNLSIQSGDRVQIVGESDCWRDVVSSDDSIIQCQDGANFNVSMIYAHQNGGCRNGEGIQVVKKVNGDGTIKEEQMKNNKRELSPQENLIRCRETLAKVSANNADPRVIGLWKAKVAQAERLCQDAADDATKMEAARVRAEAARVRAEARVIAGIECDGMGVLSEPKQVRSRAPKVAGSPKLCLCGCSRMAASGRNFLIGHDARFASYIRKLDSGTVKLEDLPGLVRELLLDNHEAVVRAREHNKPK